MNRYIQSTHVNSHKVNGRPIGASGYIGSSGWTGSMEPANITSIIAIVMAFGLIYHLLK